MDIKDFAKQIAAIGLPLLGAALPLPGGAVLGSALAAYIGAPDSTPDAILAHLTQNADAVAKAREFEFTHQETLLRINTDAEISALKIAADDRASARDMQKLVKDDTPRNLAYLITFGFFGLLGAMIFLPIPKDSEQMINMMTGSLGTVWLMAMTFYYGTTQQSARKTELMAQGAAS